ncbi:MAG: DUF4340 domain-containing protein [Chthoniobacterales bacterium]
MNPRATIALLIVTLLVVGGLFYLSRIVPASRDADEMRRYALVFDPEEVEEIDIVRGAETLSLRRDNGGWRLVAPIEDRASPEAVDRLLSTVRFLDVRDRRDNPDQAAVTEAGLTSPRLRIDLRGESPRRFDVGGNSALPSEVFARAGGSTDILRVPDTIVELATATVDSFRDPRLTPAVADDIEKFTVRRADGEMTLRRERGRWLIEKPVATAADPRAVRAFLEPLLGLRIVNFRPTLPEAAPLPGQVASISLTPLGGGEALDLEVMRGADETPETVMARHAPRGGLLEVDALARRIFEVSPEALRDRSLGYVEPDAVDRITMESDRRTRQLTRDGENWQDRESGEVVEAGRINELIELFNEARATSFQSGLTAEDAGLAPAAQRIIFSAWLSENTAEEPAGGHPIAGVELGSAGDDGVYARVTGQEEIVTIPADLEQVVRSLCGTPGQAAP